MAKTLPTNSTGETILDGADVDKIREPRWLLSFVAMVAIIAYDLFEHTQTRSTMTTETKAELAKKIAFEILCNEWADGYILDMKSIYEEKEDPKNPYAGLNEEAQFRLDELQDIILLVLKGGEK